LPRPLLVEIESQQSTLHRSFLRSVTEVASELPGQEEKIDIARIGAQPLADALARAGQISSKICELSRLQGGSGGAI